MTPESNTLFSVCLFLALCCLNSWTVRRAHNARRRVLNAQSAGFLRPSEAV